MYQKYQTDALVLANRESGEADKVYALYTRDFGLVRARASAVRRESSKMRYGLQTYSLSNVSLVKGRRSWRIAGARPTDTIAVTENIKGAQTYGRIADLVTRLVAGEEKNEYLFQTLVEAREALMQSKNNPLRQLADGGEPTLPTIEIICVARILYTLGYISAEALQTSLFVHTDYTTESIREAEMRREKLLSSINHALSETQLVR